MYVIGNNILANYSNIKNLHYMFSTLWEYIIDYTDSLDNLFYGKIILFMLSSTEKYRMCLQFIKEVYIPYNYFRDKG